MPDLVRAAGPLLLLLVLPPLAACSGRPAPGTLRVASVRQPATSLFFVAQAAGCFDREGLPLQEQTFDLGRDAIPLLQDGRADVAIAYDAVVVRAAQADPRLRVLSTLHHSTRNTRLVTTGAISRFEDLAGKRVGLARGTNAEFFLDVALRFGGVPRPAVQIVDLAPDRAAEALAAGELDAAVLSDPVAARAEGALGAAARALHTDLYVEFSLVVSREDVVTSRAPALAAFLRGLACGERIAGEQRQEALARLAARFPDLAADELARQIARVRWGLGLDNVLVEAIRREHEWFSGGAAPPRDLIEVRLLEGVAPDAVMLLPFLGPPL